MKSIISLFCAAHVPFYCGGEESLEGDEATFLWASEHLVPALESLELPGLKWDFRRGRDDKIVVVTNIPVHPLEGHKDKKSFLSIEVHPDDPTGAKMHARGDANDDHETRGERPIDHAMGMENVLAFVRRYAQRLPEKPPRRSLKLVLSNIFG